MSDNDKYQLAKRVVEDINSSITQLRASATAVSRVMTKIDNIIADQPKKDVLTAGLAMANIDIVQLNTLRTKIKAEVSHIHTNIEELTTY